MIKLRFSPPVYKTYNGGKITTCTYKCEQVNTRRKEVISEFTVQGKATCSDQDVPNERIGRNIAESRAKYLAYKRVAISPDCLEDCETDVDRRSEYLMYQYKIQRCKKRELDHLKTLTQ